MNQTQVKAIAKCKHLLKYLILKIKDCVPTWRRLDHRHTGQVRGPVTHFKLQELQQTPQLPWFTTKYAAHLLVQYFELLQKLNELCLFLSRTHLLGIADPVQSLGRYINREAAGQLGSDDSQSTSVRAVHPRLLQCHSVPRTFIHPEHQTRRQK